MTKHVGDTGRLTPVGVADSLETIHSVKMASVEPTSTEATG